MDTNELQKKSDTELEETITEMREELRRLRFAAAGSGMRDVKSIRNLKKNIARAQTELSMRAKANA